MITNTLFGKKIRVIGDDDAQCASRDDLAAYTQLARGINRKILPSSAPVTQSSFDRALLCYVSNSTATLRDGRRVMHALSFYDVNRFDISFNIEQSVDKEGNVFFDSCTEHYETLESILNGTHSDFWEIAEPDGDEGVSDGEIVQFADWKESARDYLPEGKTVDEYDQRVFDVLLCKKAKDGKLSAAFVRQAAQEGSYVATQIVEAQEIKIKEAIDRLVFREKKLVVLEHGDEMLHKKIHTIGIDELYVGGIRDDVGAQAIAEMVNMQLDDILYAEDIFQVMTQEKRIKRIAPAIRFLEVQGYHKKAEELRKKCIDVFVTRFEEEVCYENKSVTDPEEDDIFVAANAASLFLRAAKKIGEDALYQQILAKASQHKMVFEDALAHAVHTADRETIQEVIRLLEISSVEEISAQQK